MRGMAKTLMISAALTAWLMCASFAWSATLVWDENLDQVDGYRIYYGTDTSALTQTVDVGIATTYDLDDLDLSENIQYYFFVSAYNAAGESPTAGPVIYTPEDTTPPSPPIGLEIIPVGN